MIQEKCQCFTWSGMPTLEKIMWFILYHFAYAAAIITISYVTVIRFKEYSFRKGNGAAVAANVFWWFDLLVYFVEAALMAKIFEFDFRHFDFLSTFCSFSHVEIKGLTDQGAPKSNVEVSKK